MAFTIPKEVYNGKINQVMVGKEGHKVTMGGASSLPFMSFEGEVQKQIPIALEIQDITPDDWPKHLTAECKDVISDPVKWALYAQNELKADMVCLKLAGTHPDSGDKSPEEAGKVVEKVLTAINIPLIILGTNHVEKDVEVIKHCAEVAANSGSIIGKAQEKNYKTFAGVATAYGHKLIALSDLDINLCKQLNILLTQAGFNGNDIIIDAMSSTLGYGLEYTYSVMERIRLAALQQNDTMMQMPMVSDVGAATWKTKETKATASEQPAWGSEDERGILWEAFTATSFLLAGGDFLIMRHPKAMELVRKMVKESRD
ncbi:MAG: acetyl-CoA decarbonylase/synthase complex subunit delta [bacterium]